MAATGSPSLARGHRVTVETRGPRRLPHPWRNPWRRPWGLAMLTWVYVAWSLLPVAMVVFFSFNDSRSRSSWSGFTTDWYFGGDGTSVVSGDSIAEDPRMFTALKNSFKFAVFTTAVAMPLGTALALGTARWKSRLANVSNTVSLVPLVTPELVLGSALYVTILFLYGGALPLGSGAVVVGQVTLTIAYVTVMVRARLVGIGSQYELAGQDLGATPMQAVRSILLPLLTPAVIASGMIVFAASLDNFIITSFLYRDGANETVPLILYSVSRSPATPVTLALATLLLLSTLVFLLLAYLVLRLFRRGGERSALDELAGL